jgi:proline racemase
MACLYADGKLRAGEFWRQEGILGTRFIGRLSLRDGALYPTIRGAAYITGVGDLLVDRDDPLIRRLRL